ncbi:unnamed protein product [Staurois parvus]|uniref:Uncharacterized protein n=1 Tax=Staurois parvus TaxID=386267 RepID=A0ABN9DL62_9NEOB|nr:unnamed protein product [Staurois parvus]
MTRDCGHSTGMTRDCGHSTGMTRDCGQHRPVRNSAEVRAGTCQIQVPAPHLPKGQQSSP